MDTRAACIPIILPNSSCVRFWTILTPEGATGVEGKNRGVNPAPQTIEEVQGYCIDYIMLLNNKAKVELLDSRICFKFDGGSAFESSDHLPVYIDVRF